MPWIENRTELNTHVKFKRLVRTLRPFAGELAECVADGVLSMLWKYAFEHVQDGDLSSLDNAQIAEVCGWGLDPDGLINALVTCGFLDKTENGLVIHDWDENMSNHYEKRQRAAERKREYRARKKSEAEMSRGHVPVSCGTSVDKCQNVPCPSRQTDKTDKTRHDRQTTTPLPPFGGSRPDGAAVSVVAIPSPSSSSSSTVVKKPQSVKLGQVIALWNARLAPLGFPKVLKGSPARERMFNARVSEAKERDNPEWWERLIIRISNTGFFCDNARSNAQWLNFDWFLNETNLVKVLEGKYERSNAIMASSRDSPEKSYEQICRELGFPTSGEVVNSEFIPEVKA